MTVSKHNLGFSLIELMVGMVIAILSSIIVFQVYSVSERQKRTTTGASDAQTSGAMSIYLMDRDIKMAGLGLNAAYPFWNCGAYFSYNHCSAPPDPLAPKTGADEFIPVIITDGGSAPDSISIGYYIDPEGTASYNFKSPTTIRSQMPDPSAELNVNATYGCKDGGFVMVIRKPDPTKTTIPYCTLMEITQVQDSALKLQHNTGGSTCYNPNTNDITTPHVPAFNESDPLNPNNAWPSYVAGDIVQCMDAPPSMYQHTYRISNARSLELLKLNPNGTQAIFEIAPQIVDMQARFGIADAGSQQVNNWIDATAASGWDLAALRADRSKINRIKAVRLVLLARSAEYEKPDATGTCSTTTDDVVDGWPKWKDSNNVDVDVFSTTNLSATNSDWRCYRYKVFDTIIPLRNIIWAGL